MANNSAPGTTDDILVCPICLEHYEMPRALPCLHTFCEKCLMDWVRHKSITNTLTIGSLRCFPCPVCKDDVNVPPEGIKGFRHNFYISNMAEPTSPARKVKKKPDNSQDELDTSIVCNRCEEIGVIKMCVKCNIWLCPLCCEDHKRVKGTKSHVLATNSNLKEANFSEELSNEHLSLCLVNGHDKYNNRYCYECKEMLCESCQLEKHSTHDVINIICSLEEVRNTVLDCMGRLHIRTEILRRQHSSLSHAKKELVSQGHKTLRDFDKSIAAIQKKMLIMKGNLQKNLKKHITDQVNKLDARCMGIGDKLAIEESIDEEMQSVLDSGNKKYILTQASMLCDQGERCLNTHLIINSESIITITSPVWKSCEEDLFDQLLTKLLGSCEYIGLEVNLNKRIKSKKSKRSQSNSPRNKSQDTTSNTSQQGPDIVSANQLCEIIRDFDPLGQEQEEISIPNVTNGASNMQQNIVDSHIDDNTINEVLHCSNEDSTNDNAMAYFVNPDIGFGRWGPSLEEYEFSPASDGDENEQMSLPTTTTANDLNDPIPTPPQGPFYDDGDSEISNYWWHSHPPPPGVPFGNHPPPHAGFHGPPRHGSPHHRGGPHHHPPPPHHHPPPPHILFGPPPHHRGRGHHHRRPRHGGRRGRPGSFCQQISDP